MTLLTDLWTLTFATHPEVAITLFRDQAGMLADPVLRELVLGYGRAHDLDPGDSRVDDLARRIADATRERYGSGEPPGSGAGSEIPALVQSAVNASSPAWQRLDTLVRKRLGVRR